MEDIYIIIDSNNKVKPMDSIKSNCIDLEDPHTPITSTTSTSIIIYVLEKYEYSTPPPLPYLIS